MNTFCNLLVFFVWPFAGFVLNLLRPVNRLTYFIFIFFFFLIGCSFSFSDPSVDSYRYAEDFVNLSDYDFYSAFLYQIVVQGRIDFYYGIIALLLGRITSNPHFLYGIFGAIYGFLVCKLFILLKRDWNNSFNVYVWIIFLFIFALNPHSNINGVRFWTATWLYIISLISYVVYGKKKWLTGILLTPFIHSSFIIYIGVFIISYLFKNKNKTLFVICLIVFFLSYIGFERKILSLIPDSLSIFSHYEAYLDESYMGEILKEQESKHFINRLLPIYMKMLYLIFVYRAIKDISRIDCNTQFLLVISMICFIFNTTFSFIPSMSRFNVVLYSFYCYLMYKYYSSYRNFIYSLFVLALVPSLVIYIYNAYFIHISVLNSVYIKGTLLDIYNYSMHI